MLRKILSIALVILVAFTVSAPRAAATGVGGAALTVAEMAGVVAVIAASLGVTFLDADDMQTACNAFVGDVLPGSPMDVLLNACGVSDGYIYLRGEIAKTQMMAAIAAVRSFFIPGSNVVVEGSGVNISNLGQIWDGSGSDAPEQCRFVSLSSPVTFTDQSGNELVTFTCQSAYESTANDGGVYYRVVASNTDPLFAGEGTTVKDILNYDRFGSYYLCFFNYQGHLGITVRQYNYKGRPGGQMISTSNVRIDQLYAVSGGGEVPVDVPVFQQAGALSPDLVGGVWDQLANDAADQNGNVIIDTNTPSFRGGSAGLIPGAPDNNLVNPQQGALDSIGSTKTETDTSTGTQTQTQTQTGAQAVPQSQTANPAISDVQAQTTFNGVALTLTEIFPFCIPFDIYFMLKGLSVPRQAPSFEIPLQLGSWLNFSYTFEFEQFEQYAQVVRSGELVVFVVGLAAATRKFIKW